MMCFHVFDRKKLGLIAATIGVVVALLEIPAAAQDVASSPAFGIGDRYNDPAYKKDVIGSGDTIPVFRRPQGIAFDGHDFWVAESGDSTMARISLKYHQVEHINIGRLPVDVVNAGDGHIIVSTVIDKEIWEWDGSAWRVLASLADMPMAITADLDAVWVLAWIKGSSTQTEVVRIDRKTGESVTSPILPENGFDIASTGDTIHTLHELDEEGVSEIVTLDAKTAEKLGSTRFEGNAIRLEADANALFAAGVNASGTGLIVKFDAGTGEEIGRNEEFDSVSAIAARGVYVVAAEQTGRLRILSAADLSLLRTIHVFHKPFKPESLLILDDDLWITTHDGYPGFGEAIMISGWRL